MFHLIKMDPNGYTKDDEVSTDNPIVDSILTQRKLPRRIVENWGCHNSMGLGVEDTRDPWYFNRPVFNQLWKNAYLGVGEDGKKVQFHLMVLETFWKFVDETLKNQALLLKYT